MPHDAPCQHDLPNDMRIRHRTVARQAGLSSAEDFIGHGIGRSFHCWPPIQHHGNRQARLIVPLTRRLIDNDLDQPMVPGMVFTIEPMLCQGAKDALLWSDGWTAVTADGGRSAQFEHTILITDTGVDILTD